MLMPIFANPYPKAHEEESPIKIKAQRPTKKTEEQERSKERIQICRRSTAKRRSATNYKSVAKYRSAEELCSSAEWLWQIKTNWAQDPFDPVNIIWPTKAQILLYKKIGVKANMKKYDEKKQGTAGDVSSRNHVKEIKSKPKENEKHNRKRMKK